LAPWAILIWIWSAFTRYSVVTPKRPEATCLIDERRLSPACNCRSRSIRLAPMISDSLVGWLIGMKRFGSSPPSPVFERPPMRFIATASVVCASVEMEPRDMAPVAKRLTMSFADSTSSSGTGAPTGLSSNRPRKVMWRLP
jgi:hypothetical protein